MKKVLIVLLLLASIASCSKEQQAEIKEAIHPKPTTYVVPGECPKLAQDSLSVLVVHGRTVFNTGFASEQSSCVPAPHSLGTIPDTALYFAKLVGIQPGDSLVSDFVAEVTCEIPVGSFLAWYMQVVRLRDGLVVYETPRHGTNVSMSEHHHVFGENMHYAFQEPGEFEIRVYAYAAIGNLEYLVDNSHLVIESHYGDLHGTVFRGDITTWQ